MITDREELTISERLAVVESVVADLKKTQSEIDKKLDELLALRNKGLGAFWLASGLVGIGGIGFLSFLLSLIRGH